MRTLKYLFIPLFVLTLVSCSDDDENCLRPFGDKITKEYVFTEEIRGLEIEVPATTFLSQGETQKFIAEGHENILDKLRFNISGDVLDIEWNIDCVHSSAELDFDVTLDKIEEITIISSGNVYGQNHFVLDDIDLNIVGSGNMDLSLTADEIRSQITGSGKLELEGESQEFITTIAGSGNIRAFDLETEKAKIVIAGSGNVYITVLDELEITISGSGNVYYQGNPEIDLTITGSGSLINAN